MSALESFGGEAWLWIGLPFFKSTLLLLLVLALNGVLRNASAALRSWMSVSAFGALMLLPLALFGLLAVDLAVLSPSDAVGAAVAETGRSDFELPVEVRPETRPSEGLGSGGAEAVPVRAGARQRSCAVWALDEIRAADP